jgi:DNA-binding transcriptional regulator YdaS (Cro superfamily)
MTTSNRNDLERARLVALVQAAIERSGGQVAAAQLLGLSQSHVSRMAKGDAPQVVQRRTLEAVARALEIPPTSFGDDAEIPLEDWVNSALASPSQHRSSLLVDVVRSHSPAVVAMAQSILAKPAERVTVDEVVALANLVLTDPAIALARALVEVSDGGSRVEIGRGLAALIVDRASRG